jgi:hypothetical protein
VQFFLSFKTTLLQREMANPALIAAVIAALQIIEEEDVNLLRLHRRYLRDQSNPFEAPDHHFLSLYRLPKEFVIDHIMPPMEAKIAPLGLNPAAVPAHLTVKALLAAKIHLFVTFNFIHATYSQSLGILMHMLALKNGRFSQLVALKGELFYWSLMLDTSARLHIQICFFE